MYEKTRREFLFQGTVAAAGALLLGRGTAVQAAPSLLTEQDPTATALGYREDANRWDAKKYPQRQPDQTCANCKLSRGDAAGGRVACTLYGGRLASASGWCAAWAKRD